jgi:hypothetical protein
MTVTLHRLTPAASDLRPERGENVCREKKARP